MSNDLLKDPLLSVVPSVDGFKVLEPCILYSKLGEGGMGAVYRGRHLNLDIDVAIKCLKVHVANLEEDLVLRFQREARVAAEINNPNLIRVYDVNQRHGIHYLVMEYILGETLRERVERKGPLGAGEALTIVREAGRGLAAAHRKGVIHRDIKPDNILVSSEGEVKVADLGLAKARDSLDSLSTGTNMIMGTPQYMPPEQFEGASRVGAPGDVYALGATLYYMLCGRNAISGGSLTEVMRRVCLDSFPSIQGTLPDLPSPIVELIERATRADPSERFEDASAFVTAVDAVLQKSALLTDLKDQESGRDTPRCTLVSPPPEDVVSRARRALMESEGITKVGSFPPTAASLPHSQSRGVSTSFPETAVQPPGPPSSPSMAPSAQRRSRALPAALALLLVLGGGAGAWWFNQSRKEPAPQGPSKANTQSHLLDQARQDLRNPATHRQGIEQLKLALSKDPSNEEIRTLLVPALKHAAERFLRESKFESALDDTRVVLSIAPNDREAVALQEDLHGRIHRELDAKLEIQWPTPGAILGPGPYDVEGRIDSSDILAIRVGTKLCALDHGRFKERLERLPEGIQDLHVRAETKSGVHLERVISVSVDTTPPKISVDPPPNILPKTFTLTGAIKDATAVRVFVGDTEATVLGETFTAAVSLAGGAHSLKVLARDAAGNTSDLPLELLVDAALPVILVPNDLEATIISASSVVCPITIKDDHLDRVLINGKVAALSDDGSLRDPLNLSAEGANVFALEVHDKAGNVERRSFSIVRDTEPPKITITEPSAGQDVAPGPLEVTGTISDATSCGVMVDGTEAVCENGHFRATLQRADHGPWKFTVTAKDALGHTAEPIVREVRVMAPCPSCVGARGRCAACGGDHRVTTRCSHCSNGTTTAVCTTCHGTRQGACRQCQGSKTATERCGSCRAGKVTCSNCRGQRRVSCVCKPLGVVSILKKCPLCNGSRRQPCATCSATGGVPCGACGARGTVNVSCRACTGTGRSGPCRACNGSGGFTSRCGACQGGTVTLPCTSCDDGTCRACGGKGFRK